jgi:hypothetical protein
MLTEPTYAEMAFLFELGVEDAAVDYAVCDAGQRTDYKAVSLAKTVGACAPGQASRDIDTGADVNAPLLAIQPRAEDEQGEEDSNHEGRLESGSH